MLSRHTSLHLITRHNAARNKASANEFGKNCRIKKTKEKKKKY